jgi:hypothetical protein
LSHSPAGYLLTFDGNTSCNVGSDAYLLGLTVAGGECDRYGGYAIVKETPTSFAFFADNLGGDTAGACGNLPDSESQTLTLTRSGCAAETFQLVVHDSVPRSPYDVTLIATQCRCDSVLDPCGAGFPNDWCSE